MTEALEVRPGLLAAKKKAEASKHLVTASKRAFLPDLKLSASFAQGGLTAGSGEYGYAFGGNLAYPLTNIALLKKQVDEANATADKDVADYEVTRQKVYRDVKQAFIQLKNAKENVPVAQKALDQAKEQFNLARGRYKVGMGDVIELKDAETTYRNAQLSYYKALLDYNISPSGMGKRWDFYNKYDFYEFEKSNFVTEPLSTVACPWYNTKDIIEHLSKYVEEVK